jgi:riboflavin kinase / FMN adenylyltransferase
MIITNQFHHNKRIRRSCVFTLGTFDGVHSGHEYLFEKMLSFAKENGRASAILVFTNHPRQVLTPESCPRILTGEKEKIEKIKKFGFDAIMALPFTEEIGRMTRDQFLKNLFCTLPISDFFVGQDVTFGAERAGDLSYLIEKASLFDYRVHVIEKLSRDGCSISSSRIRALLACGKKEEALLLLQKEKFARV